MVMCLSYILVGHEELHAVIRKLIIQQMKEKNYSKYGKEEFVDCVAELYCKTSKSNRLRKQASETEIMAACDVLKTKIYIFQADNQKWLKWTPTNIQCQTETAIYLQRNFEKNHFDVLLDVQ
ncbi:unnamed protein product [Didymodactylos carnosus]|uniref:Uncharacterized protein n=1 Tax=Didymodactylos carnosus TaxID=1234261 RepID=A0A8S2LCG8_9BILA|nr:unnamed protein product [Didymodactylos carnosus]CAF3882260.1 unnamed protein product [Didymodactylos carnosus]